MTTAPWRPARLADDPAAGLRDARRRARDPGGATYEPGSSPLRERADARGYDRLVVYADREHSANLAFLTGFDPRFEEAVLILGPAGDPAILVGNECYGMAGAAPLPMRRELLPGPEPAEPAARPLEAARGHPRRRGHPAAAAGSASSAGRPTLAGDDRGPGVPRRRAAPAGRAERDWSRTPPTCSSTRPTGCGSSTRSTSWLPSSTRPARRRTASAGCSYGLRPGHDRARGRPAARLERRARCPAT